MAAVNFQYYVANFANFSTDCVEKIYKVNGYVAVSDGRSEVWDSLSTWSLADETTWESVVSANNVSGNAIFMARAIKFKPGVTVTKLEMWPNSTSSLASLKRWTMAEGEDVSSNGTSIIPAGGARRNVTIDGQEFDLIVVMNQSYSTSSQTPTIRWYGEVAEEPEPEPEPMMIPITIVGKATINPAVTSFDASRPWACTVIPNEGETIDTIKVYSGYQDEYGNDWDTSHDSWVSGAKIQIPENSFQWSFEYLKIVVTVVEAPPEPVQTIFAPRWATWSSKNYTRSADSVDTTNGIGIINLYPTSGYKVTGAMIEIVDQYGYVTGSYITDWVRNNGNGTFSLVIPQGEGGTGFEVSVYTEALPVEDRTIAQSLFHCTSNIEVTTVPHGSAMVFTSGDKLTVTADADYTFESASDLVVVVAGVEYHPDDTTFPTQTLTCSLVDWTNITSDVIVTATAHSTIVVPDPIEMSLGFVNIYNPTADEMREAGSKQYIGSQGTVSMAQYILKAFKIFAKPRVTDQKYEIMWGIYHTNVSSYVIVEPYITLNCGSVVVPEIHGNSLDYSPAVSVQLYLPFVGMVNVDTADVVDKNCTLEYQVDVLTGNCLVTLKSNDVAVNTWTGSMMENIPLTVSRVDTVNTQLGAEAVIMMGRTPFFVVKRNKPLNDDQASRLDLDSEFWSILGNLSGYTECLYVSVENMTATSVEKSEIERLLKAGVII